MEPLSKEALRSAALDARKAFVRTLSDAQRAKLEHRLAHISPRCSPASRSSPVITRSVSEISPLPAMEEARAVGAIVAFPCFANPAKPFRFLAGDPLEPGPFGIMQPARRHPVVSRTYRRAADRDRLPRNSPRPRQGPLRPRARPPEEEQGAADRGRLAASGAHGNHSPATSGTSRSTPSPRPTGWRSSSAKGARVNAFITGPSAGRRA